MQRSKREGYRANKVFPVSYFIRERMRDERMNEHTLAYASGMPVTQVHRLLTNRETMTISIAKRLGVVFDTSHDYWMNLDRKYQEWIK